MTARCPCCGAPCDDLPRLDSMIVALGLTGQLKSLFTIFMAARGRYMRTNEIVEIMWGDSEDGGPDGANEIVRQLIWRLRTKLARYPVDIQLKDGAESSARLVRRWNIINHYRGGFMLASVEREAA